MSAPDAAGPAPSFDFFLCCCDDDREAMEALQTALLSRSPGRSYFWNPPPVSGPSVEQALASILDGTRLMVLLVTSNTGPDFFERFEVRLAGERAGKGVLRVAAVMIDVEVDLLGFLDQLRVDDRLDARALGSTRAVADALCRIAAVPLPERHPPSVELVDELERLLSYRARQAHDAAKVGTVTPRIEQLAQEIAMGAEVNEGDLVAGARLQRPLGSDSFSYSFYARREDSGEPCVVKVFRLERLTSGMMLWGFRNAARALATLNDHPNAPRSIVRLLEVSPDTLAFATEYLPEGTLEHVQSRNFPLERRVGLFAQVCAAVEFAHRLGIVHGDIKPGNIALNADGRAVLTDFALSAPRLLPESSKSYARVAAPMFMAPELRDGEPTESSDIYSLGRVLYYLLLERTPPPQLEAEPQLESPERFPPSLVAIVRRATRLDPAQRYVSVKEMLADLDVHRTGGTVVAVPPPGEIKRAPAAIDWRSPPVLGVGAALLLVLLLVWAVPQKAPPAPTLSPVVATGESPPPSAAAEARAAVAGAAPVDPRSCRTAPLSCTAAEWTDPGGMVFVRICGGAFCMGSRDGEVPSHASERPAHDVGVREFWLGRLEVSNAQYRRVAKAWGGADDLPATSVTWEDADRFCRALGHRLPSEAEWEYAARGTDGRRYPWGNHDPGPGNAAFGRPRAAPDGGPSPVTSFPAGAGPFGTLHQAGNVAEWVADCFDARAYAARQAVGASDAKPVQWPDCITHVLRGGAFLDPPARIRAAARGDASNLMRGDAIGFRCARDATAGRGP